MSRLTKAYADHSRTRIMSLKEHLGDSNVSNYLCSIHLISNELALIGHPVDDLDLVIAALNGFFFVSLLPWCLFILWWALWQIARLWIFFFSEMSISNNLFQSLPTMPITLLSHGRSKQPMDSPGTTSARHNYAPFSAPSGLGQRTSSFSSNLLCQFCDHRGHTANTNSMTILPTILAVKRI